VSDDLPRDETLVERPAETDERLWSVTTIIGQSSNNRGLIEWAAGETARAAVGGLNSIQAIVADDGPDAAVAWLMGARERPRKGERTAKQLGTEIHEACETYALTGQRPTVDEEVRPFLDQFEAWCQRFQPVYEAAEMTVYSPTYGYAGTLDAILKVAGLRVVTDYKSSKKDRDDKGRPREPWPDVALQLAAYRYADFAGPWRTRRYSYYGRRYYLLGADERVDAVEIPEVDGGLCLYLTPERCEAYPVRCDEHVFEAFLYAIERAHWSLETARTVMGPAIAAPEEALHADS
jgi:hypothetical protein